MNDSEKLAITIEALKEIDWLEENSPSTVSVRQIFERMLEIARKALKDIDEPSINDPSIIGGK
jgi:hypothetical protein